MLGETLDAPCLWIFLEVTIYGSHQVRHSVAITAHVGRHLHREWGPPLPYFKQVICPLLLR